MPKSGFATQFCPCGSGLRPHVAISFAARSLHVNPRVKAQEQTIYVCEKCVAQFERVLDAQQNFFRVVNPSIRSAILGAIALSIFTIWNEIKGRVPQ